MIKDFDVVKKQLKDLASVLNGFKSEAVQLRVVELLFQRMEIGTEGKGDVGGDDKGNKPPRKKTKKKTNSKSKEKTARKSPSTKKGQKGRPGPGAIISQLKKAGFFKKHRIAMDIVSHCKSKKGYTYNTSELNVGLLRAVRNGDLKRKENDNNQFEYFEE